MASPADPHNFEEIKETNKFLQTVVVNGNKPFVFRGSQRGILLVWGCLRLDEAALKKVKEYSGIESICLEPKVDEE